MSRSISGQTVVAGVVGQPIRHSLSPLLHNLWIAAAGLDAVYVALPVSPGRLKAFCQGLGGGVIAGVNVTAPLKGEALALADRASERARGAGSANLLLFEASGAVTADNTDGEGLVAALADQAPGFDPRAGPAVILGAGGAARGAVAALLRAGAPRIDLINRSMERAGDLAAVFGERVRPAARDALSGASLLINATTQGQGGEAGPLVDLDELPPGAVVMDMVYQPLRTAFLERARGRGLATVDGLGMLIGQARPSFAALFGQPPPRIDVRAAALAALEGPS